MGGKTSSSKHQYEVKAKSAARAWDDAESSGAAPSHGPRQAAVAPKRSHKVGPEESGNELADNEVEKSFRAEMTSARSPTAGTSGPKRGKKPESQVESQKSGSARPTGRSGSQLAPEGGEADSPTGPKATLPEAWTRRLANTMILHTVQNSMILATYLLDLLTGGYGSRSALHIACWEGSLPAVQAVVNGSKAAIQQWHKRCGDLTPLHIAAICSHAEVTELLLGYDVDPNINTVHQLRSLHIAATSSSEVCEVLLANKADFMACSADKDTPLHFANCFQQIDTVELLLKARADAAAANNFGVVPLHVAVAYAGLERMELKEARAALLLCAHGARLDDRDHHGHTPAAVARMAGARPSLIEFLESDGEECQEKAQSILDMVEEDWEGEEESLTAILSTQTKAQSSGSKTPGHGLAPSFSDRVRASSVSGGSDVKLAQENAHLAQENLRLQKELEESHGNLRHVQGLLDQSRSTLDRMKSARLSVTEAPGAKAFQAVREDMEKEMEELRQRQHVLGRERENWLQEKESLHQQLNETIRKLEAAEATVKRLNEKCQALEAAKPKEISRPSSAIQRQAAELTQKSDELTQKTAALSAKDQALSEKDAELQEKRQAEQQALEALDAKDAQLDRLTSELQAMQAEKDRCNRQLEEEATRLSEKEAALDSLKKELQRLKEESTRQVAEKEETWKSLSELRAQHKELRDQQGKTSSELSTLQLQLQEREVEVDGQLKEKDLTIQKLEEDSAQLSAQVTELEGVRERAAQAEKMLEPWKKRTEEVQEAFQKEQALRKRYHNQMQDMKGAIRVFARIRPKVQREADQEVAVWRRDAFSLESAAKDKKSPPKDYNFDSVFDEHNSQEDVFADCRGLIASAVDGFNVTVFAYGQTGAGKTHTMYGTDAMPGLVPRAAEELFTVLRRYAHECESRVVCSMFELYRDDLVDLLFTKAKGKVAPVLDIKKDPRGTVKVDNAVEIEVGSPQDLQKAILMGMERRHVAATKMNADSSRSHLIFIVTIECTNKKSKQVSSGKLTLCDLAGSERLKKSEVTGEQMKEAQSINKSLTALGDVIEALTKGQKHVPYRNHRLTQLLSDSLGGNAKTLMFVNCSPASGNLDETSAALAYAVRAKNIVNKVEKNSDSQEVARLKKVIQMLSTELEQARAQEYHQPHDHFCQSQR